MDKINGAPLHRQSQVDRFQGPERGRGEAAPLGAEQTDGAKAGVGPLEDRADISPTALKLIDLRQAVDFGRAALAALPDTREDLVATARERVKSGFYNSAEVHDKLAERLGKLLTSLDET